jgi:hypothetical protein
MVDRHHQFLSAWVLLGQQASSTSHRRAGSRKCACLVLCILLNLLFFVTRGANTVREVYRFSTLTWQSALQVQLHYKFNTTHRYIRNEPAHQSWVRLGHLAFLSASSPLCSYASFARCALSRLHALSSSCFSFYSSRSISRYLTKKAAHLCSSILWAWNSSIMFRSTILWR